MLGGLLPEHAHPMTGRNTLAGASRAWRDLFLHRKLDTICTGSNFCETHDPAFTCIKPEGSWEKQDERAHRFPGLPCLSD